MSTTTTTTALRVEGVTKSFAKFRALDDVSFEVPTRCVQGLVGPNGAGKTTLFSIVAGFLIADEGEVRLLGEHGPGARHILGRVSILPQDALFDRNQSILDQLVLVRRLRGGVTRKQARDDVAEALARVGLSDYLERSAVVLSHGMTKRLGIAQAFLGDPELIFLDEPTAGLDPRNAARIRQVVRELSERSTVVISSHNLTELEDLCDHVVILDRGVVKASGTMEEIMRSGLRRLDLTFAADLTTEQLAALGALSAVGAIEARGQGRYELMVEGKGDPPIEEILKGLIAVKAIPSQFRDGSSLEEIFLALTGESPD